MQLQQVNRVGLQVLKAAFDKRREILTIVTVGGVRIEPATGLGGDVKLFLSLLFQLGQQPFAVAVAINIGRVKKVHAAVECGVQGGE